MAGKGINEQATEATTRIIVALLGSPQSARLLGDDATRTGENLGNLFDALYKKVLATLR